MLFEQYLDYFLIDDLQDIKPRAKATEHKSEQADSKCYGLCFYGSNFP